MGNLTNISLDAARKVFGQRPDIDRLAQGYIASGISRFTQDAGKIPAEALGHIAQAAGWYVHDSKLDDKTNFSVGTRRQMVADYLREHFPLYAS